MPVMVWGTPVCQQLRGGHIYGLLGGAPYTEGRAGKREGRRERGEKDVPHPLLCSV